MVKEALTAERLFKRLRCWILGHEYYVLQEFSPVHRRVCCDRCGGDWGMYDPVRAIVPWCGELEELVQVMGHKVLKR